ncbi:MAG: hypothetical protein JWL98_2201 [Xanthomonadaceae bacterium]|nr:hypothetical protein [Xanthomonadaceae bacterium]
MAMPPVRRDSERRLYTIGALIALLVVFAGFAKTYYLKLAFGTPPLSLLQQAHGLVMSSWFVLFLIQVRLIASGRRDLHRRVGVVGALLALAVLAMGTTTAIVAARLGHSPGPPPLVFLVVPLGDMTVFALLVGAGLWFRRRSDIHKRLMLLSCVGILTAAIARIPIPPFHAAGIPAFFMTTIVIVIACVAYDTVHNRRLHPAFGWGALLIIVSWPLRLALSGTAAWLAFATWATR